MQHVLNVRRFTLLLLMTGSLLGQQFLTGGDISTLLELEADGVVFMDDSFENDALSILADHGMNSIRLRLWHTPETPWNGLNRTIEMAQRIKQAGLHFLLDIHYSDWWADPGSQNPPAAWEGLSTADMADSVYNYTYDVFEKLATHDALPDMVQLGNEIGCGMLWPNGSICGDNNTADQWSSLVSLLNAGKQAVRDAGGDSIQIMIHDFRGGDTVGAQWFFNGLIEYNFEFDVIGLSYYPRWHGPLLGLAANLGNLAYYYEKPVIVVETAYMWTLDWNDETHNMMGLEEHLLPEYPASPEGQQAFLQALMDLTRNVWQGYGRGVYYWEPAWTTAPSVGSPWENQALFDFSGNALPALSAFESPVSIQGVTKVVEAGLQVFPNPANNQSRIRFKRADPGRISLEIFSLRGERIYSAELINPSRGDVDYTWNHKSNRGAQVGSGLYFVRLSNQSKVHTEKLMVVN